MWRSLRVRNYRLFASGQVVSLTGTWMQRVAQDWLVLRLSHTSGVAVGVTTALQFLPTLLFGLYGGVLADRYPKRLLLVATQTAMGAFALTLGVLDITGVVALWHVYVLALLLGVATSVDTPTRQAFVTELVGPELVPNAVSLNSATFNTARIVGPAVAGVMITGIGTGPVFLVNTATFAAVLAGLVAMREGELFRGAIQPKRRGQLREGLAYVRRRPDLYLPIVLVGVVGMLGFNFQITMALMAKGEFHRGAAAYGLLSTALATGSLLGALLAARRERPRQSMLIGAAFLFGVLETVDGLMPSYETFIAMLVVTGVFSITVTTTANSTMQLGSSAEMRGRVMALYLLVFLGTTPFGAPLIGWIAEVLGPRFSLIIGGLASASAAAVVGLAMLRLSGTRVREWRWHDQAVYDEVRPAS